MDYCIASCFLKDGLENICRNYFVHPLFTDRLRAVVQERLLRAAVVTLAREYQRKQDPVVEEWGWKCFFLCVYNKHCAVRGRMSPPGGTVGQ